MLMTCPRSGFGLVLSQRPASVLHRRTARRKTSIVAFEWVFGIVRFFMKPAHYT